MTKRGARSLHSRGILNRWGREGQSYWRCVDRNCPGRVSTDENDALIFENNAHNHQPNVTEIAVGKIVDAMKERAKAETTSIPRIYQETMQRIAASQSEDVAATVPTFTSLKRLYTQNVENDYLLCLPHMKKSVLLENGQKLLVEKTFF